MTDEQRALSDRLYALKGDVYPPSDETLTAMCAELKRLRATVARAEALEPFVFKDPRMPAVVSYHALCTALGVALALDGDASAGEDDAIACEVCGVELAPWAHPEGARCHRCSGRRSGE